MRSETKRKIRKILSAIEPSLKPDLLVDQLKEDTNDTLKELVGKLVAKFSELKNELLREIDTRLEQAPDLSEELVHLESELEARLQELEKEEIPNIQTQMQDIVSGDIEDRNLTQELEKKFEEKFAEIRKEFRTRMSNLGGGNANRQINVNSSVITRYTDINFQQFGNIGWTTTLDDDFKRVNIRASILVGGGGSGITRTVSVLSVSSTLAAAATTDYVYFANVGINLTLPTAVSNTNSYTVKNMAASSVLVTAATGQDVDGSATALMPTQYESLNFYSNGSVWGSNLIIPSMLLCYN